MAKVYPLNYLRFGETRDISSDLIFITPFSTDISNLSTEDHDCIADDDDKHEKVAPEDQTCHN